jgi:hypothetical protein
LFSGLAHPVSVGLKLSRRYFRRLGEKKFAVRKLQGFLFFCKRLRFESLSQMVGEFCVLFMCGLVGLWFIISG